MSPRTTIAAGNRTILAAVRRGLFVCFASFRQGEAGENEARAGGEGRGGAAGRGRAR